ncbi:MAG: hypothetical protein FWC89_12580 [Defluviitaleaceae bacterium]|nr:hypothetical protein [Defluviitaleaceae bacterium]
MSRRRNRSTESNSDSGGERGGRSMGSVILKILKIKVILFIILLILAFFGVLYIINWVRNLFSPSSANYIHQAAVVLQVDENPLS